MDATRQAFLAELYAHGRAYDSEHADRLERLRNVEPETAELLGVLVRALGATRVLEIGTSNGYSTIWLAWSVQRADGRVVSIERDPAKQAQAKANLDRAALRELVDLRCGDATSIVATLDGPFDCVFFDADRRSAP